MRTVRISDAVWNEIGKRGKFGETVDDVLRRVFRIEGGSGKGSSGSVAISPPVARRRRLATRRMSASIYDGTLEVSFNGGESRSWLLPERSDKVALRNVRDSAVEFAKSQGATMGQINAVKKALTEAGYHLTK